MKRGLQVAAYVVFLAVLTEFVAQAAIRIVFGEWHFTTAAPTEHLLFEPHPYLVGAPIPGATETRGDVTVSINSSGFRGDELGPMPPDSSVVVLALGGSTTFGTRVDQAHTWPRYLQSALDTSLEETSASARAVEVINAGVPGYTTAENIIQLSLQGVHLRPDLVILFQGINDLHTANSPDLRSDYANFHGPSQWTNLQLHRLRRGERSAFIAIARGARQGIFATPRRGTPTGPRLGEVDEQALAIFRENLTTLASICEGRDIACLFVPQVLPEGTRDLWWFRYMEADAIRPALDEYNAVMAEVAGEFDLGFAAEVLATEWAKEDFADSQHFSAAGNRKFSSLLLPIVEEMVAEGG